MSAMDDTRLAMGIRQLSDFGTYLLLWCGALDSTTPTIMGNVEASKATTVSAKLYVDGNSFTTGYAGSFTSQIYGVSNQIVSQHNATGTTTSVLTSTGNISANISIDAVGDQIINFGTLSNLGTRFTTAATDNWTAEFRNNIKGSIYSLGEIKSGSSIILKENSGNDYVLTSAVAPSSVYNHFLQPKTGTLCDVDQRIINMGLASNFNTSTGSYVRVSNFLYGGTNNLGDFMSNLFVAYSAFGGFLVSIKLQDVTNSQTIAKSASFASGGFNKILTLSSFSNIPAGPAIFELQCSTQTSPDITLHFASLQL
eukprot:gene4901-8491_t